VAFIGRRAAEAMAEIRAVELDDQFQLPTPRATPMETLALDKLISEIDRLPLSDSLVDWQRSTIASIPRYLRNQLHYGAWAQQQELDELVDFLGYRPTDVVEADRALSAFVRQAGPELDIRLLKLFHRRLLRLCHVITGPNPPRDHLVLMKVEPILQHRRHA
jgi:hypothetical protein